MITEVTCSSEMRQAINENLHGLLTGKRKSQLVREVNNTLSKMLIDVKMEMMNKAITRDSSPTNWFDRRISGSLKQLEAPKRKLNGKK